MLLIYPLKTCKYNACPCKMKDHTYNVDASFLKRDTANFINLYCMFLSGKEYIFTKVKQNVDYW